MNTNLDYLNIDIPRSWKRDQESWSLNDSVIISSKTSLVNNWLKKNNNIMATPTSTPGNSQISMHKLQLKQITNNIQQLELHLATLSQLDETNEVATNISNIEDNILDLKQEKQNIERDIKQSLEISNIYRNRLAFPQCGTNDKQIAWKIVYNAIPSKIDGSDREEFACTWKILKTLAETHEWSERNLCEALNHILIGEANDFFSMKRDQPFQKRIAALLTAYMPTDNYMTRRAQLQSFKRRSGDSIEQFMSKLEYYIERTNIGYPENIRKGRKDNILEITLLKVCSPSAKLKIEEKINQAYETGYFLTIDEKIAIASRQEIVANDMP